VVLEPSRLAAPGGGPKSKGLSRRRSAVQKFPTLAVAVLLSVVSMPMSSEGRLRNESMRDQFVGAWRLKSLEEPDANGKIQKADCSGLLVFTEDGHMSVQLMCRNSREAGNATPSKYAQGGYEASFGTYEIENTQTFTFHVEGALVRTLVGNDLKRAYELSGKHLIVKSSDSNEHWRVLWERY
jgi:hypothetical protein